jgi:hypothetical protein
VESEMVIDRRTVERQIGRPPRGVFDVVVRCSYRYPQVIRVHPLVGGKPFPTLFWLTCPHLCKGIDHLEADGWVKRLESQIASDPALRSAMHAAHRRTMEMRIRLLSADSEAGRDDRALWKGLQERGIGGLADWDRLKCLHLHAAQALADENPAGTAVLSMLPAIECPPKQVICSAYE